MLPHAPHRNLQARRTIIGTSPLIPAEKRHGKIVNLQARLHVELNIPEDSEKNEGRNASRKPAKDIFSDRKNQVRNRKHYCRQFQHRILQELFTCSCKEINHWRGLEDHLSRI